jgi:hypothetical protein
MEAINGTGPYNDTGVRAETVKKTAQIHVLQKYIAHELDGIAAAMKTKTKGERAQLAGLLMQSFSKSVLAVVLKASA